MATVVTNIEEYYTEYQKAIGLEVEMNALAEANQTHILFYADALGDNNPLWIDEEYARKSRFGMITASPTFLFHVNTGTGPATSAGGTISLENISAMYSGAEFELFQPIWLGDRFTVRGKVLPPKKTETRTRGTIMFVTGENRFFNQRHELVGIYRPSIAMVPITRTSREAPPIRVHDPDEPEWAEIREKSPELLNPDTLAFDRKRRGAEPRYWEDVQEGQEMEPLEKGVLTASEITRWSMYGMAVDRSPLRILSRPRGGAPIVGLARAETSQLSHGVADPEDFGPQRSAWLGQLVTDWMGDDGILKRLTTQIRGPNMMGDINVIRGKVTKKYTEGDEHLVDLDIFCENQGGTVSAPGRATVVLPTRG